MLAVSAEQKTGVWALFNPKMGPELFDSLSRTFFSMASLESEQAENFRKTLVKEQDVSI